VDITSTLEILTLVAHKVSLGDWSEEIHISSQDEVGDLARVFQHMMRAIQESSDRLFHEKTQSEAIVSCMPEGIIVTDMSGRLILANHRAESLFNFSSQEARGQQILERLGHADWVRSVLKSEGSSIPLQREITVPHESSRNQVYVLTSSLVLHPQSHQKLGVITVVRDITHEKELSELRDGFLRTVTHELRTPLTSIMGFLELVQNSSGTTLTPQKREWLSISLQEASSLKSLIDDLLDLSQIRAGRVKMHLERTSVSEFMSHMAHSFLPLAKGKNLNLVLGEIPADLMMKTDIAKLRRILVNLISNAIKFTHEGDIRLRVDLVGSELIFAVEDTGIGLKEDQTEVIFEKFRQIDYSSTRQYEGIGLGLSIVKQLVQVLGGRVWVHSTFGQGSIFYFSLPA
jgi:two-component system phosphate regulon sensor histidine kinase PhoR